MKPRVSQSTAIEAYAKPFTVIRKRQRGIGVDIFNFRLFQKATRAKDSVVSCDNLHRLNLKAQLICSMQPH